MVSEFAFYFRESVPNSIDSVYTAHIRLIEGSDLLEFEVRMNGINLDWRENGREIVAKWHLLDSSNNEVFYTDSNGLEMQERVLNSRPDYTLDAGNDNFIPSNYYPVTSAIAIRDIGSNVQMTVMNDRAQGGSVI